MNNKDYYTSLKYIILFFTICISLNYYTIIKKNI